MGESCDLLLYLWCILRTVFYGDNFYYDDKMNYKGWSNLAIYISVFLITCLAYIFI